MEVEAEMHPGVQRRAPFVSLALVTLGAGVLAVALTARLGGTVDSIQYLFAARSLAVGDGFIGVDGEPFVQWAPLYASILSVAGSMGLDLLMAARVVAVVALASSALLAGLWTRRITGDLASAAAGGVVAVLLAPALLTRYVWSEPLFISFVLAAGLLLTVALQRRAIPLLAFAGGCTGLAAATRWAGLPLLAMALYVAWAWPGTRRDRALAALVFGLPGGLTAGVALGRNAAAASQPLPATPDPGRSLGDVVGEAMVGLSSTVVPPGSPWPVRLLAGVLVLGLLGWAVRTLRTRRTEAWWAAAGVPFAISGLYVATNVASALLTSIGSLSTRMLTPAHPPFFVGAVGVVWAAWSERTAERQPSVRRASVALAAALPPALVWTAAAVGLVRYGTELQPRERLGPRVVDSEVLEAAAGLVPAALVSNSPVNAAWVVGQPVSAVPQDPVGLREMDLRAAQQATYLVWFEPGDGDGPRFEAVARRCVLVPVGDYRDGALLRIESCGAP